MRKSNYRLIFTVLLLVSTAVSLSGCLGGEAESFQQASTDNLQPLEIDPKDVSVEVGKTRKFNGVGGYVGSTGYRYSLLGFGGKLPPGVLNPITGVYTAPATLDTNNSVAVVQVKDARGAISATTLIIIAPMQVTPTSQTLTVGKKANFDVIGGVAPITWTVIDPTKGSIVSNSGLFTANYVAGTTTVRATDAAGNTSEAVVVVRDFPKLTPTNIRVPFGWTLQMVPFEGSPPFTYDLDVFGKSNGGSIDANGLLTSPNATGAMIVSVKDYYDYVSTANLEVIQANTIVSGEKFNCVLFSDTKGVKCWGDSTYSQTGYNQTFVRQVGGNDYLGDTNGELGSRVAVHYINNGNFIAAKTISSGRQFSCVIDGAENVRCWGKSNYGELGNHATVVTSVTDASLTTASGGPKAVAFSNGGTLTASQITTGAYHVCVVDRSVKSKVYCWGLNDKGQLGLGNTTNSLLPHSTNSALNFPTEVLDIKAGESHTCVLLKAGVATGNKKQIRCWGDGNNGQLGFGSTSVTVFGDVAAEKTALVASDATAKPVDFGTKEPTQLTVGSFHTCALLDDGATTCWGDNSYGQLGRGLLALLQDHSPSTTPIDLGKDEKVLKIKAGYNKSCFILLGGWLKCVGNNTSGSLGVGKNPGTYPSVGLSPSDMGDDLRKVSIGTGFYIIDVSIGQNHVCGLMDDNRVKCWGNGDEGQLGNGGGLSLGADDVDMGDNLSAVGIF